MTWFPSNVISAIHDFNIGQDLSNLSDTINKSLTYGGFCRDILRLEIRIKQVSELLN